MSYAGDATPVSTYTALRADPSARLIDVRTRTEWATIGVPELPDLDQDPDFIEWHTAGGVANPSFLDELGEAVPDRDVPVYFLCRSGVRSKHAATLATAAGFTQAFNVSDGFEGPPDTSGRRGTTAGWQSDQLPWKAYR